MAEKNKLKVTLRDELVIIAPSVNPEADMVMCIHNELD